MRLHLLLFTSLLCSGLLAQCSPRIVGGEPNQDTPTAKEILVRVSEIYENCKSYRDTGVVTTIFNNSGGKRTVEKPFNTAFVRPNRFRFEYYDKEAGGPKNRYIIAQNANEIQSWWEIKRVVEQPKSLGLALAGATGVSSGSAHTIPALLLPKEINGSRLTALADAKRIDDGDLENVKCFRIQSKEINSMMTLWIDKESYLVRRIDERKNFDDFSTEVTTIYEPIIDGEIPDIDLAFDPPKAK